MGGPAGASPLAANDGLNFMRIDHPAPFSTIDDYEVGNEEYGSWEPDYHTSPHNAATYAQFSATFYNYAQEITQTAGLPMISIGLGSDDPSLSWTKTVMADEINDGMSASSMFISDHSYAQTAGSENDSFLLNDTVTDPSSVLDWTTRYDDYEVDAAAAGAGQVAVIATEWNSVATDPGKQSVSLVNGLYTAESVGSLLESGYSGAAFWGLQDNGELGNNDSSSLYGWREFGDYGLFGNNYDTSAIADAQGVLFPSYFGMQLASKIDLPGGTVVSATSSNSDLNVYAVDEADGDLELLVVNTSPTNSATDTFLTPGFTPGTSANVWQYGETQDTAQENSPTAAAALSSSTATLSASGSTFSYSFPAYSMTVLDIPASGLITTVGAPVVTASGTQASFTAGGIAVTVDPGVTVSSSDTDLTGAVVTISAGTLQPGDTLNFTSPSGSGIVGIYAGGSLTLSGTATVAQYQSALQSVTFSSTSSSTATRSISIVALDGADQRPDGGIGERCRAGHEYDCGGVCLGFGLDAQGGQNGFRRVPGQPRPRQHDEFIGGLCLADRQRPARRSALGQHQHDLRPIQRAGQQHRPGLAAAGRWYRSWGCRGSRGNRFQIRRQRHVFVDPRWFARQQ